MICPKTTAFSSKAGNCILTQKMVFTEVNMFFLRQWGKKGKGEKPLFLLWFFSTSSWYVALIQQNLYRNCNQADRSPGFISSRRDLPLWVQSQAHQPAFRLGINLLLYRRAVSSAKPRRLTWKTFVESLLLWSSWWALPWGATLSPKAFWYCFIPRSLAEFITQKQSMSTQNWQ